MYQTIKLDKKEIDDNIKYHKFNEFNEMLNIKWPVMILPEIVIHCLRKEIKWTGSFFALCYRFRSKGL
jgi:hypothetical protein